MPPRREVIMNNGLFGNGVNFQDPIQIGQPTIYIDASQPSFMTDSSGDDPETQNEQIYTFKRFSDNGLTFTQQDATRAEWVNNIAPTQSMAAWFSDVTAQGLYQGGTTSSLPFMHQASTCKFTVYLVFRNRPNEATGTTKMLISTTNSTGTRGFQISMNGTANPGNRFIRLVVNNNTAGQNAFIAYGETFRIEQFGKQMLVSFRVNAIGVNTGNPIGKVYNNGKFTDDIILTNALATQAASSTIPSLGNRASGGLRFGNYFCELIIFPEMHSEKLHQNICNHLIRKWNIR